MPDLSKLMTQHDTNIYRLLKSLMVAAKSSPWKPEMDKKNMHEFLS